MKTLQQRMLGLVFAVLVATGLVAGCNDDHPPVNNPDGGQATFSGFVTDLIVNHTSDTTEPVDIDTPDAAALPDNEDETAYNSLFQ